MSLTFRLVLILFNLLMRTLPSTKPGPLGPDLDVDSPDPTSVLLQSVLPHTLQAFLVTPCCCKRLYMSLCICPVVCLSVAGRPPLPNMISGQLGNFKQLSFSEIFSYELWVKQGATQCYHSRFTQRPYLPGKHNDGNKRCFQPQK